METNQSDEYTSQQLFEIMNRYIKYYVDYDKDSSENLRDKCIEMTKELHELMVDNCNFIKIADKFSTFIDEQIESTQNLSAILVAIDYLFSDTFMDYMLDYDITNMDSHYKNLFHYSLIVILINKMTLYHKYSDEEIDDKEMRKHFLENSLPDTINCIVKVYKDLNENYDYPKQKENIMELLCSFDLEDIYANDNGTVI